MNFTGKEDLEMLRDLVAINQDRVVGYSAVASYLNNPADNEFRSLVEEKMQQAQQYKSELIPFALAEHEEGLEPIIEKRIPWPIASRDEASPMNKGALLDICIRAEKESFDVYLLALKNTESMENRILRVIESQQQGIRSSITQLQELCLKESKDNPSENHFK